MKLMVLRGLQQRLGGLLFAAADQGDPLVPVAQDREVVGAASRRRGRSACRGG